ncbi:hypothetical protein BDP27DRAFT_1370746 [Rhodocollybia butyracea]|uniref:Uncharacterized protein n=1 Tax=Rhodocollybia butyracea TaxID=206335 RepID=A0A9P5PDJ7_9AGAR|nr:hypothetical protein BDP27DRAFT_1370746 [Rhodocollybia butyracea]
MAVAIRTLNLLLTCTAPTVLDIEQYNLMRRTSKRCFGFLVPEDQLEALGIKIRGGALPKDTIGERIIAYSVYCALVGMDLTQACKQYWSLPRWECVRLKKEELNNVVSLYDNFSNHFGKLGTTSRPGPEQLDRETIKNLKQVLGWIRNLVGFFWTTKSNLNLF